MAFQPIVDLSKRDIHAYEALVRGVNGEGAHSILSRVQSDDVYRFDQACRTQSLKQISALESHHPVSINFMPNAVYDPETCLRSTIAIAKKLHWPLENIIFEITETELIPRFDHLADIVNTYRSLGLKVALDDFGSGSSNLETLVHVTPDYLKLDRALVDGIGSDRRKQKIANAMLVMLDGEATKIVAEGVETAGDAQWLFDHGITLQQGYFFARPQLDTLPPVNWPSWSVR
ncbi:EAL domain-containing protein [Larsenimonas suaedae]|uniref:EAL domain-containing protein n=1 Tax=Larsenimonas suaedae TaxID=1851019 RepID=A0ABU1GYS5_9GAMM|nr:EAL domain-containing protein [Larsenimonas suaedae]MCM2973667.1 EAL domain-containing protein [Larsenimonas suaedae]MDR5897199.1 EAL domain-containing protein [Larsenimonas suaedae]